MSAPAQMNNKPSNYASDKLKFFSIVKNEKGELVAKGTIPEDLLNDLQEKVRAIAEYSVGRLVDSKKIPPADLKQIQDQVEEQQVQAVLDYMGRSARNAKLDAQLQKEQMYKEIEQTRKALEDSKKKTADLKKAQAKEVEDLYTELKEKSEADTRMYKSELSKAKLKDQILKKQNERLRVLNLAHSMDKTCDKQKDELVKQISLYKKISDSLSKKLTRAENKLVRNKKEKEEETEKLKKLQSKLRETHKKLEASELKANDKTIISLNEELQELQNYIEKLKKERKCLLDQREILLEEQNRSAGQAPGDTSEADCEKEIVKVQESVAENRAEIEKLRLELSKRYDKICQSEEEIKQIRQQLIKERNNQKQIEGKHVREFLKRQTEIYKLEMVNAQNQILRVKQEKTLTDLKKQIANLKH